jgi:chromosome segregation protein
MYLKNLTVLGFKSFADKTSLNFQPGVSAIVGPNGCGKSNVSDAIRWVLGEQSAKALRGGEMADVIFNGTDSRKPLGMAEVSLTIGGVDDEHLKAAGVEIPYDEVTLTRRVFRDGGSEYFLNKTPCRLKDIQQLFMGTGVGRSSYSIMAQGNITQILSSKPEDRRLIFEEAAGITKFKAQKKEALRKLDHTDQNLLRVQDLIKEVKRQIGSLQRQAGKARRYKQFMTELQHLDTQLARHQFDILQTEIKTRAERGEGLRTQIERSSEEVLRCEDEILQLRSRLSELEQEISRTQQHGIELKGQVERNESRIHFNEQRLLELQEHHGKALNEIAQAEERVRLSQAELEILEQRLEESNDKLTQHRQTLAQRQEAVQAIEASLIAKQDALRQEQSKAFSAAQAMSRVRNEINSLDLLKQGNIIRLEKLSAEKVQLEEERIRLEQRLQEFHGNVETFRLNVQATRGTVEERQQRLREVQQSINEVSHQLDGVLRQQAETRSKLNLLEQLAADHEGFSGGSLAALKQTHLVLGSLADRIQVPTEHIAAIETALGHHLQLVITDKPEAAEQILADLASNKRGRASIAALELSLSAPEEAFPPTDPADTSLGMLALDLIQADESVRPLLRRLLGRTRVVVDLAAATAAWRASQGAWDFVTADGQVLARQGVYTGGAGGGGKAAASILGRKNQIADLQAAMTRLLEESNESSRAKGALVSEQTALQAGLQEAQTELREHEVAVATHQGELNALHNSLRMLHQKIETVVYEIQSLSAHDQEGAEKRSAMAARAAELELQEKTSQEDVLTLSQAVEELRQSREHANTSLTETKVLLASDEQLSVSLRQQKQPLEQRLRELGQLIQQRQQEIGSFGSRHEQYGVEIEESRRHIITLQHEREQVNQKAAQLLHEKQSQEAVIGTSEESLRDQRRQLTDAQHQRGTIEVELAQKTMAVQNLRERIQQKYQLNLDDVQSECIKITFAEEGPARVETLTPEDMAASGVGTDWAQVAEQVQALQKRLDEIGPVNLVAIEEYEETEQRFQFLTQQNDDLVKAKEQLLEVLSRINTQTREMFVATFNQIRDNFRAMFVEIFGGGKADLILVDDNDVLESGIDIVARPPGKQLQSITLLSGGEQTMTAVALMFSIYQVKPSPFCILDELDAPLDESNINRFIRVLQRFLDHSQFIIITHNKRTIGMADVLYGVTMQEQGVSRIVSVKFTKGDGNDGGGKALVPPPAETKPKDDNVEVAMAK